MFYLHHSTYLHKTAPFTSISRKVINKPGIHVLKGSRIYLRLNNFMQLQNLPMRPERRFTFFKPLITLLLIFAGFQSYAGVFGVYVTPQPNGQYTISFQTNNCVCDLHCTGTIFSATITANGVTTTKNFVLTDFKTGDAFTPGLSYKLAEAECNGDDYSVNRPVNCGYTEIKDVVCVGSITISVNSDPACMQICLPPVNGLYEYTYTCDSFGNSGCTPGYWKNCANKSWTDAGYNRTQLFSEIFGITDGRRVINLSVTTLNAALDIGGGQYAQLARHGTAALLNAGHGFFPLSETMIKNAVMVMFNSKTPIVNFPAATINGKFYPAKRFTNAEGLATYLDVLNNAGCPINNHGYSDGTNGSRAIQPALLSEVAENIKLSVVAYPNPTNGAFTININSSNTDKIVLRVTNVMGKLMEHRSVVVKGQTLTIGESYPSGIYYIEVRQGKDKKQLTLQKLKR